MCDGYNVRALILIATCALLSCGDPAGQIEEDGLIRFIEVTREAGIGDYRGQSFGAAWGDVNGDGWPDLWASGHSPQRLFVNARDGRLVDRTAEVIDPIRYSDRHNAAWADLDQDGDEDLLQLSGAGRGQAEDPNALYRNEAGRLLDVAPGLGLDYGRARARAGLWLDLDGDDHLDLLLTAAAREDAPPALFQWDAAAQRYARQTLDFLKASETAQLAQLTDPGHIHVLTGLPHALFVHEVRGGRLASVGPALGLANPPGHSVADVLIADLDNDLAQDIVFVRGFAAPDFDRPAADLVRARLQANPSRQARLALSGPTLISVQPYPRGKHWWGRGRLLIGREGRIAPDMPIQLTTDDPSVVGLASGREGLFLGWDADARHWLIELRAQRWDTVNLEIQGAADIDAVEVEGFDPNLSMLKQFVQWNGEGGFGPPDGDALVRANCFAGAAADFDNDMDVDIYLVCSDYLANQPNILLENLGKRRFRRVFQAGGAAGSTAGIGESVALADYDLDGFIDLFVRNGHELPPFASGPDQLLRNLGHGNHWLQLDLVGTRSSRGAIGARIEVLADGVWQMRVVDNGIHGRVQDFRRSHFGLGANDRAELIRIHWPAGTVTEHHDVAADQIWRIREDGELAQLGTAGLEATPAK